MSTAEAAQAQRCRDCQVEPGQRHQKGCDVALCAATGHQWIQCEGQRHEFDDNIYGEHEERCQPTIWTGKWPGIVECREWNLWSRHVEGESPYWQKCVSTDEGAGEDLNTLASLGAQGLVVWSIEHERWVKP